MEGNGSVAVRVARGETEAVGASVRAASMPVKQRLRVAGAAILAVSHIPGPLNFSR